MDYTAWRKQGITTAELIPITILALEALLGVACNLVAAATYCKQKRTLLHNPGNTFTISLMIDDLILSGVATPLIIAIETLKMSGSPMLMEYLCLGTRCALLYSAVSSASGNALLALDRGDLTLRPSKRFFRRKRATISLIIARFLSITSLFIPIVTSWQCREKTEESRVLYSPKDDRIYFGKNTTENSFDANNSSENDLISCNATCSGNHCSVNTTEFQIRTAIQTVFFICAAIIIIATYTRILQSVKRRDVKRASKNMQFHTGLSSSKDRTKLYLGRWCKCSKEKKDDTLLTHNNNNQPKNIPHSETSTQADSKSTTISLKADEDSQKKEDSSEAESSDVQCVTKERNAGIHPGRAHFASVALSVQAFISLKRIVKEKMEIKRRKHRHLQRMTIAITLTFLLCWMPFHILPYVRLSTAYFPKSITCKLNHCISDSSAVEARTIVFREPSFPFNVGFLWTFVLVSISSITNPCLYSFSREKIRKEFSKIFCKNLNTPLNSGETGKKTNFNNNLNKKPVHTEAVLKWKRKYSDANVRLQKS